MSDEEESIERVDRISHLPEPILHRILSFLYFKQAAQTCVLSKTWEKAWHRFPYLRFDAEFFHQDMQDFPILQCDPTLFEPNVECTHDWYNGMKAKKRRNILLRLYLLNYVEESLRKRYDEMVTIEDFVLDFEITSGFFSSIMDHCVGYAIGCHVKRMRISTGFHDENMYTLPQNVLCAESLHVLYLIGVRLESPMVLCAKSLHVLYLRRVRLESQMVLCAETLHTLEIVGVELESPRSVKLSSLRKLYVEEVLAAEGVIYTIIAGCPLIEDLSLMHCRGFKTLELFGLPKLKDLNLSDCQGFKSLKLFDLPNLNNVTVHGYEYEIERLEMKAFNFKSLDISGFAASCKIDIALCKNLNSLIIHNALFLDEFLFNQLLSHFPVLKYLSLSWCNKLERIKISSLSLKRLSIHKCESLVEVKLETPKLRKIEYSGDLISFSLDGFTLLKTILSFFTKKVHTDTQWYFKYIELVKKFHSLSKELALTLVSTGGEVFPVELRQTISPLYCGVKHLKITTTDVLCVGIKNVMDDLLWLSPHAKTLSIIKYNFYFQFQFSYKRELIHEGEICECCKSVPITCWRQCIEKVEIKYSTSYYCKQIKRYVFEGEEIWEKMDCLQELLTK